MNRKRVIVVSFLFFFVIDTFNSAAISYELQLVFPRVTASQCGLAIAMQRERDRQQTVARDLSSNSAFGYNFRGRGVCISRPRGKPYHPKAEIARVAGGLMLQGAGQ